MIVIERRREGRRGEAGWGKSKIWEAGRGKKEERGDEMGCCAASSGVVDDQDDCGCMYGFVDTITSALTVYVSCYTRSPGAGGIVSLVGCHDGAQPSPAGGIQAAASVPA